MPWLSKTMLASGEKGRLLSGSQPGQVRTVPITSYVLNSVSITYLVLWRCFSHTVVFLYLMEEETSLLVLVPAGIATIIEVQSVL